MAEEEKIETPPEEQGKQEETKPEEETPSEENKETPESEEKKGEEESPAEPDNKISEDVDYSQKDESEVADELKNRGFNYEALCQEYATTGGISEKTRAELAKVGITQPIVDNYIAGMEAKREQDYNEVAEVVGGREKFDEIIQWAAHNCDVAEINYINSLTNKYAIKSYLRDLKGRMETQEGKTPNYQKGDGDKGFTEMFNSQAEMFEAINDPKYKKDEYYRSKVQKKIAASREAGVDLGIY